MSVHAIIPVKSLGRGKTRLAPVLSPGARADLVAGLLVQMLDTVAAIEAISRVSIISGDADARELASSRGADVLADPTDGGLNAALEYAAARAGDASAILVLPVDLPCATAADIAAMVNAGHDNAVAIAPDRSEDGTNALYRPRASALPFRFGPGSFAAHCAAARAAGLALVIVRRPGLAFDLDTPDDYAEWVSDPQPASRTRSLNDTDPVCAVHRPREAP